MVVIVIVILIHIIKVFLIVTDTQRSFFFPLINYANFGFYFFILKPKINISLSRNFQFGGLLLISTNLSV